MEDIKEMDNEADVTLNQPQGSPANDSKQSQNPNTLHDYVDIQRKITEA